MDMARSTWLVILIEIYILYRLGNAFFSCYILFDKCSILFYSTSNGYNKEWKSLEKCFELTIDIWFKKLENNNSKWNLSGAVRATAAAGKNPGEENPKIMKYGFD